MHTTRVKDEAGNTWVINHHGDWSGDAKVERFSSASDAGKPIESYLIPGVVLRACGREGAIRDAINALESME